MSDRGPTVIQTRSSSGGWAIVIVLLLLVIAAFLYAFGVFSGESVPVVSGGGSDVNVNVEAPTTPAAPATPATGG